MDAKLLTENGWKTANAKVKLKDNSLQKALATYENLNEKDHDGQLKCISSISQIAGALRKTKEVAAEPALAKYLASVADAADLEKNVIAKAKAAADKAAAASQKKEKADADANEKRRESDEEAEESGNYSAKLLAAFQKLKSAEDLLYEFVVCDAKPVGVMVAKKITAQHKAELTKLTGSKRFIAQGTCSFQEGKFTFGMEKPVAGMARRLQESIKNYTGKKLPILAGAESVDETDEPAGAQAKAGVASTGGPAQANAAGNEKVAKLHRAAETWHGNRTIVDGKVRELKKAIQGHYADSHASLLKEIDKGLSKLDAVLDKLDHRLAESLSKAGAAPNEAARQAELKNSKVILTEYIGYVKSEPLIAHMDSNPFGVKTNIKQTLLEAVTHAARSIG